ncbi:MAG TPA: hypothetical protein VIH68_04350, partial [Bacteroidota bacterium]
VEDVLYAGTDGIFARRLTLKEGAAKGVADRADVGNGKTDTANRSGLFFFCKALRSRLDPAQEQKEDRGQSDHGYNLLLRERKGIGGTRTVWPQDAAESKG